jgi:hypothetical protein
MSNATNKQDGFALKPLLLDNGTAPQNFPNSIARFRTLTGSIVLCHVFDPMVIYLIFANSATFEGLAGFIQIAER